jgi:hypothetical protein
MTTKVCGKCKIEKNVSEFHRHRRKKDGLDIYCKVCASERKKEYRLEHGEEIREKYRIEHPNMIVRVKENIPDGMKRCFKCKEIKPVDQFSPSKQSKDGRHTNCKACRCLMVKEAYRKDIEKSRAIDRERHSKNRESDNAKQREHYLENRDKVLEQNRKYRAEHKEELNEKDRLDYLAHAEERREEKRIYRRDNPEKVREANRKHYRTKYAIDPYSYKQSKHKRKARIKGNGGSYTSRDIELQLKNQGYTCWWCGLPFNEEVHTLRQSVDHRIPIDRGGDNNPGNIVLAHLSCNCSKKNKMPWEWSDRLL